MVLLVCGGRNYRKMNKLFKALDAFLSVDQIELLVEGGAEGADKLAGRWAMERGIPRVTVWANWEGEGRKAGPNRNARMLKLFKIDLCMAFPGGKGTKNMIKQAKEANVPVWEVDDDA